MLRHHAARSDRQPNAAATDWIAANPQVRFADAGREDPLPEYLSLAEARQLIGHLSSARPRPGRSRDGLAAMSWQEVRNRASVALQLGAGLTPGDVRALTLDSPVSAGHGFGGNPGSCRCRATAPRSRVRLPSHLAAELLQYWLQVRLEARVAGIFLFPSTRTGKPWLADSQYKNARDVLAEAGMASRDGGSFRLRHTFAIRQLRRGTDAQQVARWLGVEPGEMKRYELVLPGAVEVV